MTKPRRVYLRAAAGRTGVSRFPKLNTSPFRVWAPAGAPCRIEYSAAVLRQARSQSARRDAEGVLYGRRENGAIRVVAARPAPDPGDPSLGGFVPIGIFSARPRGEVFLTERDLERFEKIESGAVVALVIAGSRAGFFVHEPDGSLQSIKSHLEFPLDEPLEPSAPASPWNWKPLAAPALIAVAASLGIAHSRLRPQPPPVALTVQDENFALRLAWNPSAVPAPAMLEIVDGGVRQFIGIAGLNGLTYARRSGDVTVRLAGETARFTGADPPVPPLDRLRGKVAELDAETRNLKAAAAIGARRVAEMERILSKMDLAH